MTRSADETLHLSRTAVMSRTPRALQLLRSTTSTTLLWLGASSSFIACRASSPAPETAPRPATVEPAAAVEPADSTERVVVTVPADATIATLERELGAAAGSRDCMLWWGRIGDRPEGLHELRVVVGEHTVLEGWLACDVALPDALQIGLVRRQGGTLSVGHPSGPGRTPLDPAHAEPENDTFALFEVSTSDHGDPASTLAADVATLSRMFRFAVWPIPPAASAP